MEWVPIVFFTFKIAVFGTGMFFAIKWHYDREKAEKEKKKSNEAGGTQAPAGHAADAAERPAERR